MQSAFVDVGLERDAFLYVTDFMELEDPEESDELDKAAAAGGNQAPREVRNSDPSDPNAGKDQARQEDRSQQSGQKADQPGRSNQRQDRSGSASRGSQERPSRDRRPVTETGSESSLSIEPIAMVRGETSDQTENAQDATGEGGKRWRGRRRRRGGRGSTSEAETQSQGKEPVEVYPHEKAQPQPEIARQIQAWAAPESMPLGDRAPAAFVLPGESLSKYGAAPAGDAPKSAPETSASVRPSSSFKPATMVQAPLAWDGSGLLPGESISKHRSQRSEQDVMPVSQDSYSSLAAPEPGSPDAVEEKALVDDMEAPSEFRSAIDHNLDRQNLAPVDDDFFEETSSVAPEAVRNETGAAHELTEANAPEDKSAADATATSVAEDDEVPVRTAYNHEHAEGANDDPETDRDASHHIDPNPPSGFRLFGLGGKKKKPEDESPKTIAADDIPIASSPAASSGSVRTVSAFAPGSGLVEEELIEGEEFDTPHHAHSKADDHDLDEYEEETLQSQIRSGELGEMLQEAHLDHKIQLKFEDKNGDDEGEESFDDEEDEEEEPVAAEGQPAGEGQTQQRRERSGRGRRGRAGAPGQGQGNRRGGPSRRSMQTSDLPIISDLLKPGQEILVQIAKEPIAKKGARITSHIALPGRFLVFMPTVSHVGVSRKIASDDERQRLKRILTHERGEASGGFIVRTAAEGASEEELRADLRFLIHLWDEIKQRSDSSKSPALIYHDLSLIERILRDQVSSNFSSIWVDSEADYERIVRFLNRFSPDLVRRVKLYTKEVPLFEHFGIQDEISKALRSKVWLKSGGSIVINQTEALVAIDINTGKYVGKTARLEDTILKTNLDAIPEIVRQIRLRDLGGIIVIDFIDMDERKNRFKVMAALEEALKSDRAPTKVLQFNDFGLVAITRKRVKQSLERTLSVPCPTCQATGMVKSSTTVCNEIYTELRKMKKHFEGADVLIRVNPETVKVLKANNASWITEFEELISKNILIKSDATLHPEQFDIQG